MKNPKEKAKELVEKFYRFANSTDFDSDHGEFFTNNELWKNNSKQCALICVGNEYHAQRELLFNLRSCGIIPNERIYLVGIDDLIKEEKQVKQEIEKL